jgi:hypothetical protein
LEVFQHLIGLFTWVDLEAVRSVELTKVVVVAPFGLFFANTHFGLKLWTVTSRNPIVDGIPQILLAVDFGEASIEVGIANNARILVRVLVDRSADRDGFG